MAGRTAADVAREARNSADEKKGKTADAHAAVGEGLGADLASASRKNAKDLTPSEDEAMPKMKSGESPADYGARMRGWRERKQASQAKAFDKMSAPK